MICNEILGAEEIQELVGAKVVRVMDMSRLDKPSKWAIAIDFIKDGQEMSLIFGEDGEWLFGKKEG